jgi:hypothetical protein
MGDLLGSLVWRAKRGQYCVIGSGSLHTRVQSCLLGPSELIACELASHQCPSPIVVVSLVAFLLALVS